MGPRTVPQDVPVSQFQKRQKKQLFALTHVWLYSYVPNIQPNFSPFFWFVWLPFQNNDWNVHPVRTQIGTYTVSYVHWIFGPELSHRGNGRFSSDTSSTWWRSSAQGECNLILSKVSPWACGELRHDLRIDDGYHANSTTGTLTSSLQSNLVACDAADTGGRRTCMSGLELMKAR